MLDPGDLRAFGAATRQFADHASTVLFDPRTGEGPDGDLAAVPALLGEAAELGLLADPTAADPIDDWGVWGANALTEGCRVSFDALETLGAVCAGLAGAVHAHGIGRLALTASREPDVGLPIASSIPSTASLAAAFVPGYGVALDARTHRDAVQARWRETDGGHLEGTSPFVWSQSDPDLVIVAARSDDRWLIICLPTAREGIRVEPACRRIGIRATQQFAISFDDVPFDEGELVASGTRAERILAVMSTCDWLGCAAIALGAARAAYARATTYSASRRQGGSPIIDHAAVRLLLANAAHHIDELEALLTRHATVPLQAFETRRLVRWAISARLGIAEHAAVAVTDSLQTHGGYGYMDDYGLSKRLRDVHAIAARHGSREQLLLLRHDLRDDVVEQ